MSTSAASAQPDTNLRSRKHDDTIAFFASEQRWLRLGILCAVTVGVLLAVLVALSTRPFASIDENAHTSYALQVAHGHLPTMRTPTVPLLPGMFRQPTYVANHPPAYYLLAGMPMRASLVLGHPRAGLFLARLVTVLLLAGALLATAWAVWLLRPDRPQLAIIVPALIGVLPVVSAVSGQVMNDAAALAATSVVLAFSILVVQRGLTLIRFALLAAAAASAALTRSSGLTVVLVGAMAAGFAAIRAEGRSARRWLRGLACALALLVLVVLSAGWFYVRNRQLYGDVTGAKVALAMFKAPHTPALQALTSARFWLGEYSGLFGRPQFVDGTLADGVRLARWIVETGLVCAVVSYIWRYRTRSLIRAWRPCRWHVAYALLALQAMLTVALFLNYASRGGATFPRYLMPAFLTVALLVAAGLQSLPGRRWGLPASVFISVLTWIAVQLTSRGLSWRNSSLAHLGTFPRLREGMDANGLPAAALWLSLLLTALVLALLGIAWSLSRIGAPGLSPGGGSRSTESKPPDFPNDFDGLTRRPPT